MSVRKMGVNDLEYIWRWRNHPNIRRFMLTQHEISFSEHLVWFNSMSQDDKNVLLIVNEGEQPRGCVIFSDIQRKSNAHWSFYSAPENAPGIGTQVCATALEFAFHELGIYKVAGQVLDFNKSSIRVHQKLGFTQEGNLRKHILINGEYHDLLCFGILSNEWG
jgi:UDP-4-amino-4,6-dideoxy-N-acetyl-beta-L-altrosamine N-acetyltransferase